MSKRDERLNRIVDLLRQNNVMMVRELACQFDVSQMTIRRDLDVLSQKEVVKLIHGAAVFSQEHTPLGEGSEHLYSYLSQKTFNPERKLRIGRKAAEYIEPNDIIIIDSGTTTEALVRNIAGELPVTILCYTANILNGVIGKKNCKLIFAGGYYHENTLMFESREGVDLIKRTRASKAFIAAGGVSDRLGVTCFNHYETETKRAVILSSLSNILLADSSKFGRITTYHFADLKNFSMIITDDGISQEYERVIRDAGVELVIV